MFYLSITVGCIRAVVVGELHIPRRDNMSHTIWYLSSLSLYPTQIADIPAHTKVKKQFLYNGNEILA